MTSANVLLVSLFIERVPYVRSLSTTDFPRVLTSLYLDRPNASSTEARKRLRQCTRLRIDALIVDVIPSVPHCDTLVLNYVGDGQMKRTQMERVSVQPRSTKLFWNPKLS